jgi:hypothetical protein
MALKTHPGPLFLWVLSGCATTAVLDGARTLEPGQSQVQASLSAQRGGNALSNSMSLPMPDIEVGFRRGLSPDLDAGVRLYGLGAGCDLRYRFLHTASFDAAFAPGFGVSGLLVPLFTLGSADLWVPLRGEVDLSHGLSFTVEGRAQVHQLFSWMRESGEGSGTAGHYELLTGGGARIAWRWRRFTLGGYVEILGTTRASSPWLSGGLDAGWTMLARPTDASSWSPAPDG